MNKRIAALTVGDVAPWSCYILAAYVARYSLVAATLVGVCGIVLELRGGNQ